MNFLKPGDWARAVRSPVVLTGLAVDLAPLYAAVMWHWGAAPLVLLYWIENVIAGVMTLPRIVISGAQYGPIGLLAGAGMSAFFVFHYGLFCAVHGTFLMAFIATTDHGAAGIQNVPMMDIPDMIGASLRTGEHMDWMIGLIVGWQVFVLLYQFLLKGDWRRSNPMAEMFAPYSRIIVLHFALFAGAGALFLLGDPMIGVLGLILFRAVWGLHINSNAGQLKSFGTDLTQYDFGKMLKGENPTADDPGNPP